MKTKSFIVAIIFVAATSVSSAQTRSPVDTTALRLVAEGKIGLSQNEIKKAEKAFQKALKKDKKLTTAMSGLAEVAMAKREWIDANEWYEKILEREPQNLDALYHRAICYRESGVSQNLLQRHFDWKNSAKYFERVLAQDSLYGDTIYQYAQLLRYRGKYTEAIFHRTGNSSRPPAFGRRLCQHAPQRSLLSRAAAFNGRRNGRTKRSGRCDRIPHRQFCVEQITNVRRYAFRRQIFGNT
jgi:hypothetical protein